MHSGEFLQGLDVPEPRHRPVPPSKRLVRILGSVVEPAPAFLPSRISKRLHRSRITSKSVGNDWPRPTMRLHRALQKLQRCPAIPPSRGKDLKHLTFVVDSAPWIMSLVVDADKHLIKVPAPVRPVESVYAPLPDLTGKHRAEPVPPETHRLVRDVDAAFEQNVFDLAQRQRIADDHHHREADDLGRAVEITNGIVHHRRQRALPFRLKPVFSDNAPVTPRRSPPNVPAPPTGAAPASLAPRHRPTPMPTAALRPTTNPSASTRSPPAARCREPSAWRHPATGRRLRSGRCRERQDSQADEQGRFNASERWQASN